MPDEGFRKWLGVEYMVMEEGHAVVEMNVRPEMQNLRNIAQGGVVAALIDVAMSTAASAGNYDTRKRGMAPLELKVNYLAGASGKRLKAVADVIRAGSRTSVLRCEVFTDEGEVCAAGLGTFMSRRIHKSDPAHVETPTG